MPISPTCAPALVAGLITFLTNAYIIFVNPTILGDAGMPETARLRRDLPGSRWAADHGPYTYFPYAVVLGMGILEVQPG